MAKLIAHRANIKNLPENSLEAVEACLKQNVNGIELDIRHDTDGVPILSHDYKPITKNLPRLVQALDLMRGQNNYFFLEFKDRPTKESLELVYEYFKNESERLRIISFHHSILHNLKNENAFFANVKMHALHETPRTTWAPYHVPGIDGVNSNFYWLGQATYFKTLGIETCLWWLTDKLSPTTIKMIFGSLDFLTTDRYELYAEAIREEQIPARQ